MNYSNDEIKNYASFLNNLSGNELALIATLSGYFLSQGLTVDQLNSIGNFFETVGQIILCIGAQEENRHNLNGMEGQTTFFR